MNNHTVYLTSACFSLITWNDMLSSLINEAPLSAIICRAFVIFATSVMSLS